MCWDLYDLRVNQELAASRRCLSTFDLREEYHKFVPADAAYGV
jgi:hypothetical protein